MAQRLIQGVPDILTPLAESRTSGIKRMQCPRCGSSMGPSLYVPAVFSEHDPLPRTVAKCPECGSIIDPQTQIVLHTGDPRAVGDALPKINPTED